MRYEISQLWHLRNGFKHVWGLDGWPFAGQPEFNDYVLTRAPKTVVLLHRRNLLQRIVSDDISHQSNLWHVERGEERAQLSNHSFEPLDKAAIRRRLEVERHAFSDVQKRLDQARVPYKIVSYEELFGDGSESENLSVLGEVIGFITKRPFRRERLAHKALDIMDPTKSRLNSIETYEHVPLIHEIEEQFGCAETGYLFR